MKKKMYGLGINVILSLVLLTPSLLLAGDNAAKPSKAEVVQKAQNLHVPFIANEGQVDDQVRYYAKTFSGTVYVTREGEIMYALPKYEKEVKDGCTPGDGECMAGKVSGTGVYGVVLSCFYNTETISSLSEPLQCRGAVSAPSPSSPLPTQVEKLFTVKPGASPDQIKISLSGVGEEFGIWIFSQFRIPHSALQIWHCHLYRVDILYRQGKE